MHQSDHVTKLYIDSFIYGSFFFNLQNIFLKIREINSFLVKLLRKIDWIINNYS